MALLSTCISLMVFIFLTKESSGQDCLADCFAMRPTTPPLDPQHCSSLSAYAFCLKSYKDSCYMNLTGAEAEANSTWTLYLNTCNITEEMVSSCSSINMLSCSAELQESFALFLKEKYTSYCQYVPTYISCMQEEMNKTCDENLKMVDVFGDLVAVYGGSMCKGDNADYTECIMNTHDKCSFSTLNCSTFDTVWTCLDEATLANCTDAGRARVLSMANITVLCSTSKEYAQCQEPIQACLAVVSFSSTCEGLIASLFSCLDQLTNCSQLVALAKSRFSNICQNITQTISPCAGFTRECSAMFNPPDSAPPEVVLGNLCGMMDSYLTCADSEVGHCKVKYPSSFLFSDLKSAFNKGCSGLMNSAFGTCAPFKTCLQNMDILTIKSLLKRPSKTCSLGMAGVTCAKYSMKFCSIDDSEAMSYLDQSITEFEAKCGNEEVYFPSCPLASTCTSDFFFSPSGSASQIFLNVCQKFPAGLTCLNKYNDSCQFSSFEPSYTFQDIAQGLNQLCGVLYNNPEMSTCQKFTDCIGSIDISQVFIRRDDPKFMCSILAKASACAAWATPACRQNSMDVKRVLDTLMKEWYNKCPNADLPRLACPSLEDCPSSFGSFCEVSLELMTCYDTALTSCQMEIPRPYNLGKILSLTRPMCSVLDKDEYLGMMNCTHMTTCMRLSTSDTNFMMNADPRDWCRIMRNMIGCGSKTQSDCGFSENTEITQTFDAAKTEFDKLCLNEAKPQITSANGLLSNMYLISLLVCASLLSVKSTHGLLY